jgi:hypothetical protein
MSVIWFLLGLLVGWFLLWREIKAAKVEARYFKETSSKLKANLQAKEFEQWIEATKDKCEVCNGNHHKGDCPNVPSMLTDESSALFQSNEGIIDLTGPEDLFASEKMRLKREERQFLESLESELRKDHPKREEK